mmetsp:Transcript_8686/g.11037  ORF Transcript_8686/g.11037 Transcript_8686/m.11037 type:complete len:119 (+) Transcript_8686:662-1018(+)
MRVGMFGIIPNIFCMGRSNQVEANTKPGADPEATVRGNRHNTQPAKTDNVINISPLNHPKTPIISSSVEDPLPCTVDLCSARSTTRPRVIRNMQDDTDHMIDDTASLTTKSGKSFIWN